MRSAVPKVLFQGWEVGSFPDCDCACGVEYHWQDAPPFPPWGRQWQAVEPSFVQPLMEKRWYVHYTPQAAFPIVAMNHLARQVWKILRVPQSIERVKMVMNLPPTEIGSVVERMVQAGVVRPTDVPPDVIPFVQRASTLTAWLYLTQQCNLRCPYCYVPHRGSKMSLEVARASVEKLITVARKYGYAKLRLKYAGGEPLLNFSVLRAVHREAQRLASAADLELEGVILTNGVLWDEEKLDFVASEGLSLGLSLDGDEGTHNRLRALPNGEGTFRQVIRTLDEALKRGITLSLSITVTAWNLHGLQDAVAVAMERGLPFNLNFVRERDPLPWVPGADPLVNALHSVFDVVEQHLADYPRPLTHILDRSRFDFPHVRPCAAGRDYLAIRPDGGVAACQMEVEHPLSTITTEDPLREVRLGSRIHFEPTVDELEECAQCPWRYVCAGGCPLLRGTEVHRQYCWVYRQFYPELVRLEGLRLLLRHQRSTERRNDQEHTA